MNYNNKALNKILNMKLSHLGGVLGHIILPPNKNNLATGLVREDIVTIP